LDGLAQDAHSHFMKRFWIMDFERGASIASLEKSGDALTGIANGNFGW
jgi:hypothetical protein